MKQKVSNWNWLGVFVLAAYAGSGVMPARAVEPNEVNAKSLEDLVAFVKKTEDGDALFQAKKWSEAAATFAKANGLFVRSVRRDASAGQLTINVSPNSYPALRYYGYGMVGNAQLKKDATGKLFTDANGFNAVIIEMWQDAAILSGASKAPLGGNMNDEPTIVEMSKDQLDSFVRRIYGPVSSYDLPVQDNQWQSVMLQARRAQLILSYALQKYPEWKTEELNWSNNNRKLQVTGDEAFADAKAKLAEAEPEYKKLVSDFKAAEPRSFTSTVNNDMEELNRVLAGVNRDGFLEWRWFDGLYISKDYLSERRKMYAKIWSDEGKPLPPAKIKPFENKVTAIKAAVESRAARWSFPPGKTRNAAIESQTKNFARQYFSGATILKTALSTSGWQIVKDSAQMPQYRQRATLVLLKKPGQKWAWLIESGYKQDYAGGGTYNSSGLFSPIQVRMQKVR